MAPASSPPPGPSGSTFSPAEDASAKVSKIEILNLAVTVAAMCAAAYYAYEANTISKALSAFEVRAQRASRTDTYRREYLDIHRPRILALDQTASELAEQAERLGAISDVATDEKKPNNPTLPNPLLYPERWLNAPLPPKNPPRRAIPNFAPRVPQAPAPAPQAQPQNQPQQDLKSKPELLFSKTEYAEHREYVVAMLRGSRYQLSQSRGHALHAIDDVLVFYKQLNALLKAISPEEESPLDGDLVRLQYAPDLHALDGICKRVKKPTREQTRLLIKKAEATFLSWDRAGGPDAKGAAEDGRRLVRALEDTLAGIERLEDALESDDDLIHLVRMLTAPPR